MIFLGVAGVLVRAVLAFVRARTAPRRSRFRRSTVPRLSTRWMCRNRPPSGLSHHSSSPSDVALALESPLMTNAPPSPHNGSYVAFVLDRFPLVRPPGEEPIEQAHPLILPANVVGHISPTGEPPSLRRSSHLDPTSRHPGGETPRRGSPGQVICPGEPVAGSIASTRCSSPNTGIPLGQRSISWISAM